MAATSLTNVSIYLPVVGMALAVEGAGGGEDKEENVKQLFHLRYMAAPAREKVH